MLDEGPIVTSLIPETSILVRTSLGSSADHLAEMMSSLHLNVAGPLIGENVDRYYA
jgi:hypothetical protein